VFAEDNSYIVREAVERGDIWWERYESYLRLRDEAEEVFYRC
jgi:putative ribosome biogenesis GTPase RsgA